MSFPLSARFSENITASPPPTAYNIPSTFKENGGRNPSSWTKSSSMGSHKCDDHCCNEPVCSRYNSECHKKCVMTRKFQRERASMNAGFLVQQQETAEKDSQRVSRRLSLGNHNKENMPSPLRKSQNNLSAIPRFKKNVTEAHEFSFVGRQRTVHNCFIKQETSVLANSSAIQRTKQENKNQSNESIERDSLDGDLQNSLNISYTVLPKIDEDEDDKSQKLPSNKPEDLNITDDDKTSKEPKPENFKTPLKDSFNSIYFTPQSTNQRLTKTEELSNSTRSKKYYDISCETREPRKSAKNDKPEEVQKSETSRLEEAKPREIFGLSDCNFIFLIGEEFIDDDYDSYMENLSGTKGHSQVLHNQELYEMTRYLVRMYLNQNQELDPGARKPVNLKKKVRRKRSKVSQKTNVWEQVETLVKSAMEELKCEFRKEIHDTTTGKLDSLISEIKTQMFNANRDIDDICAKKTTDLLAKLENVALKF